MAPGCAPDVKKGGIWANECRSVKDIDGRPLDARPKNGWQGPQPQGLQIYGAMETQRGRKSHEQWPTFRHHKDRGEPLQVQQDWTSVPPPDSH